MLVLYPYLCTCCVASSLLSTWFLSACSLGSQSFVLCVRPSRANFTKYSHVFDMICDVFWHLRSLDVSQLRWRSCTLSDCMEEVNCRHRDGLCDDSVLCSLAVCITVDPLSSLLHSDSLFLAPDILLCKNPTIPFRLNGTIASLQGWRRKAPPQNLGRSTKRPVGCALRPWPCIPPWKTFQNWSKEAPLCSTAIYFGPQWMRLECWRVVHIQGGHSQTVRRTGCEPWSIRRDMPLYVTLCHFQIS